MSLTFTCLISNTVNVAQTGISNRSMSTRLEIQTACFVRDADRLHKGNDQLIFIIGGGGLYDLKKKRSNFGQKTYLGQSKFYFTILRIVIYTNKKTGPRRERKIISRPGNVFQPSPLKIQMVAP